MKTSTKILKILIGLKKPLTIREISQKIKSDYRITYLASQELIKKNILNVDKFGNSSVCSLNDKNFNLEIYKAEDERRIELLKNKDLNQILKEVMSKIESSEFIILLFGSYAKKSQKKHSDIDLMFISNDKNFEERIETIFSLLPLKTHFFVFTEEEFKKMKDSKKPNVTTEAIKNNVILYGIENYYRLKNA